VPAARYRGDPAQQQPHAGSRDRDIRGQVGVGLWANGASPISSRATASRRRSRHWLLQDVTDAAFARCWQRGPTACTSGDLRRHRWHHARPADPLSREDREARRPHHFDFTASNDQTQGPVNLSPSLARGCCYYALIAMIDPTLPNNVGVARVSRRSSVRAGPRSNFRPCALTWRRVPHREAMLTA